MSELDLETLETKFLSNKEEEQLRVVIFIAKAHSRLQHLYDKANNLNNKSIPFGENFKQYLYASLADAERYICKAVDAANEYYKKEE